MNSTPSTVAVSIDSLPAASDDRRAGKREIQQAVNVRSATQRSKARRTSVFRKILDDLRDSDGPDLPLLGAEAYEVMKGDEDGEEPRDRIEGDRGLEERIGN